MDGHCNCIEIISLWDHTEKLLACTSKAAKPSGAFPFLDGTISVLVELTVFRFSYKIPLAMFTNVLLAICSGKMYGIDVETGELLWRTTPKDFGTTPFSISTYIPFGNTDYNRDTIN
jgi:hypothetical protein